MNLKPKLGYFDLTMIIISLVIGIGIFKTPSVIAGMAGNETIFYLAWIAGSIIAICGGMLFAEIGSRLPTAGGFYRLFSHCYHPALAFMFNWTQVIINAGSIALVGIIGAEYINPLLPEYFQNKSGIKITVTCIVLVLGILNYMGIKMGARAQNILSTAKIVLILFFCSSVFWVDSVSHSTTETILPVHNSIIAFGLAMVPVFFSFGGYQQTVNFGADIKNPEKNFPRAVVSGILTITVLYLLLNIAYIRVLGFNGVTQSKLLAAELAQSFMGTIGFKFTVAAIFISVCGYMNASIMSNPRVYYAMAEDGMLPGIFKKINEKTQAQEFALVFFISWILLSLFMLETFDKILNYVMFMDSIALAAAGASVFLLRKKAKSSETPYSGFKTPLFPLIPALYISVLLWVAGSALYTDTTNALIGLGLFMAGYPLFLLLKKIIPVQQNGN